MLGVLELQEGSECSGPQTAAQSIHLAVRDVGLPLGTRRLSRTPPRSPLEKLPSHSPVWFQSTGDRIWISCRMKLGKVRMCVLRRNDFTGHHPFTPQNSYLAFWPNLLKTSFASGSFQRLLYNFEVHSFYNVRISQVV